VTALGRAVIARVDAILGTLVKMFGHGVSPAAKIGRYSARPERRRYEVACKAALATIKSTSQALTRSALLGILSTVTTSNRSPVKAGRATRTASALPAPFISPIPGIICRR
jgi:hypothetical protein